LQGIFYRRAGEQSPATEATGNPAGTSNNSFTISYSVWPALGTGGAGITGATSATGKAAGKLVAECLRTRFAGLALCFGFCVRFADGGFAGFLFPAFFSGLLLSSLSCGIFTTADFVLLLFT